MPRNVTLRKYVFVSGRSSHTRTGRDEAEATAKFRRDFPYAKIEFKHVVSKR